MTDHQQGGVSPEIDLVKRALAHYQGRSTDMADTVMEQPVSAYIDPERYRLEVDRIFRSLPLALCLSIELPKPGSYLAMEVADVPVLLVRGDDGVARAFLNICRHRGAPVCAAGKGEATVFSCPYHAWTYGRDGTLRGIYAERTFGPVEKEGLSLHELPSAECAGLVFVGLKREATFDIEDWLGDFREELETLDLGTWHVYAQRTFDGPGWKVAWDGYLEAYHHNPIHGETVGKYTIGNLLLQDVYGPHQRITFARKSLKDIVDVPANAWDPDQHIRKIHSVFPNLSISGILGDHCLVSQVFPGPTPTTTTTRQTVLCAKVPETEAEREASETFSQLVRQAVVDEDYAIGQKIQDTLKTDASETFLYGRNEPALQHYHSQVARFAGTAPPRPRA
ncbi:MAG: aromatic ring-hydroxylating dioxygenase subunit alpha [Pseudomonadota bacterium]